MKAHVVEKKKKELEKTKYLRVKKKNNFKHTGFQSKAKECYHYHRANHFIRDDIE